MSQVLETKGIFKNLEGRIVLKEEEIYKISGEDVIKKLIPGKLSIHLIDFSEVSGNYNCFGIEDVESAKELRDYLTNSIKLMEKYPEGLKI